MIKYKALTEKMFVEFVRKNHFRSYTTVSCDKQSKKISAPPLNLTVETMPDGYHYHGNIGETINCSATMNPNTTVLSLIGKMVLSLNEYVFAERKNVQTFVDSESIIDCYPTVRTVFSELVDFLVDYSWVGNLANDTVSGQSSITEFKFVNAVSISR